MSRLNYIVLGLIVVAVVTLFNLGHVNDRDGSRSWSSGNSGSSSGGWSSGGGGHK